MADTLGILVSSDKHLDHVVELVSAAHAKGKQTQVFFTGSAVHLTIEPRFAELAGKAKIWICDVSFRSNGLHGREDDVPGVDFKSFATQGRNAEMLAESDRYVVL
jgi:hypothetical protein